MNIRKIKKKKMVLKLPQDQQRTATDKLFELSWLYDEKQEDASHVLADTSHINHHKYRQIQTPNTTKHSRQSPVRNLGKILSLDDYRRMNISLMKSKKLDKLQNKPNPNIKNELTSEKVFVGKKRHNSNRKAITIESELELKTPEYRTITIPSSDEVPRMFTTNHYFNTTQNNFKRRLKTLGSYQGRSTMYESNKKREKEWTTSKSINAYIHNISAYLKQSKKIVNRS